MMTHHMQPQDPEQLDGLRTSFLAALQDFKDHALQYTHNAANEELYHAYIYSKAQVQQLSRQLQQWTETCQHRLQAVQASQASSSPPPSPVLMLKQLNHRRQQSVSDAQRGSEQLEEDSEQECVLQWNRNLRLFGGLVVLGLMSGVSVFMIMMALLLFVWGMKHHSRMVGGIAVVLFALFLIIAVRGVKTATKG